MRNVSFICDYALVDALTLMYKADHFFHNIIFTTFEDVNEDTFKITFFPFEREISNGTIEKICDFIEPYLYVDPEIFADQG